MGVVKWNEKLSEHLDKKDGVKPMVKFYKRASEVNEIHFPPKRRQTRTKPAWSTAETTEVIKLKLKIWKEVKSKKETENIQDTKRLQEVEKRCKKALKRAILSS